MIVLRTGANRGSFTTFAVNWSGHSAAADQTISGVLPVSFLFSSDMKTALSRPLP